jgi:hypothetical protein
MHLIEGHCVSMCCLASQCTEVFSAAATAARATQVTAAATAAGLVSSTRGGGGGRGEQQEPWLGIGHVLRCIWQSTVVVTN